jgi:hypothetical protein
VSIKHLIVKTKIKTISAAFLVIAVLVSCGKTELRNENLTISTNKTGLIEISDKSWEKSLGIDSVGFAMTIDGKEYSSVGLVVKNTIKAEGSVTRVYESGEFTFRLVDELKPGWHFFSRQMFIESNKKDVFKVNRVALFSGALVNPVREVFQITGGKYGLAFRLGAESDKAGNGCFMLIQNPFVKYEANGQAFKLSYDAEMKWNPANGAFPSDRMCVGTYELTGNSFRQDMAAEWVYEPDPAGFLAGGLRIDYAEVKAVTECARAFLVGQPQKGVRVHVGWCENDYQIDMAKPENRVEYKRMIDQASATGCNYVLYTPDHSIISSLKDNADAWGWESLLFLNLGQKIRKGEWMPKRDPIPADIQDILDYAKGKNIKLLAYAYPSLPWMQNPEWTDWRTKIGQKPEGYLTVDTGIRSFQDWWVNLLVDFYESTGIGGYSFDHWWMNYTDDAGLVSSKYQQWFGTRRILEELRHRAPEMIVDGRQQYHGFGTWTWLAGTYPHPLMTDEQPGSFNSIPDLSTDRVTAGRQRWVAWRLMTRDFTPVEIRPGFITHQTQREDAKRVMRRDKYRTRDWDFLGWKFNLISSVATAPYNNVVNYLPARDEQEFNAFSEADKLFFKKWMDFTDQNRDYLKNIMPIIGQPMVGRCDGTSAILDNKGFIFLFNPNYRKMNAEFNLDETIGIDKNGKYLLTEIFPGDGLHPGHPVNGLYAKGDAVGIPMDGVTARVYRIEPFDSQSRQPVLFNCTGKVSVEGDLVKVTDATGLTGESLTVMVYLPAGKTAGRIQVNGNDYPCKFSDGVLTAPVKFGGSDFRQAQQFGTYDAGFTGETVEQEIIIPMQVFVQLENRKKAWPITYTEDDLVAPWVDPSRLLLYVQIAEPYHTVGVGKDMKKVPVRATELKLEIDGKPTVLKEAYNGVYPFVERTNLGFFTDISALSADTPHKLKLTLPKGLKPGQFQGIFVDHVENEYTSVLQ